MDAISRAATMRTRMWLRATLLVALLCPGTMLSVRAAEPTTAQTPVPLSHPGTLVGRTSAAQTITVAAALKPANQKALDTFLADLYDPASPTFHHYLTPQSFTQRFFDPAARKQVASYLQAQGFTVHDPGLGALIDATGTVGQVEQAFTVRLSDYRDAKGRVFFANDVTPALPVSIANVAYGIIGLDNAPVASRTGQTGPAASAPGASLEAPTRQSPCAGAQGKASATVYLPSQFATAYHLDDLPLQGYHGEGQKVALFEVDDYHDSDPAAYQACFGTSVPLTRVLVDGGPTGPHQYDGEVEVDLDIEVLTGLAPKLAGILVYMATNDDLGFTHVGQRIANDNLAPIVSISLGVCEWNERNLYAQHLAVAQMAAQGQSVFAGSGDSGSTGCLPADQGGTHQLAVSFPAADHYVTAVGGTHLTINGATSAWVSETVLNDYPTALAGGGGVSFVWGRLAYQQGPGTDNPTLNPNNARMVPDVTSAGDFQYIAFAQGTWQIVGGTSAGTPLWAAGATLINQYLLAHGKTRLGFANPALYAVFDSPSYATAFHDITVGNICVDPASTCIVSPNTQPNMSGDLYTATAGYDMASGIGSPMFGKLAIALAGVPLSPTITSITPNSGLAAGGNPVTITGTNFVAGTGVFFSASFYGASYVPATNVVVVNATTITATVPASATGGTADVTLTTPGPGLAQITLPGAYTYLANPLPGREPGSGTGNPGALPNPRQPTGPPLNNPSPLPPRRP